MAKEKPKICFLVSDTNPGGVATMQKIFVKNINRDKFKVVVVAFGPGEPAAKLEKYADEYHRLPVGSCPILRKLKNGKLREDYVAWLRWPLWVMKSIWHFVKWLRKEKVHIIHTHILQYSLIAGISGRIAGIPSVWHIHVEKIMAWRRGGPFLVEGYLASLLATRFVAVSDFTASTFHHSWKRKTVVIHNAIDAKSIIGNQHPSELRELANVSANEKLVGVLGLISHRKGFDRFIEMASKAAGKREDVKFVIIGGTPGVSGPKCLAELVELSEKSGMTDKLCFAGNIDNAQYYLGDMDVFFMSSRSGTETFGLVVTEAMAAGVPVVAFANDAMPEIIEEGKTGFMVPEGDTTLAAERILQILDDPQLADEFKRAARDKVLECFDIPVLINKIECLYEEILK